MFLGNLTETEKQAFLCLANLVIKADNIVENREMELLHILRGQMNSPNLVSNLSEEESYRVFSDSKQSVKRAVYIELLSLAMADGTIDANEKDCMKSILTNLTLTETFAEKSSKWIEAYFKLLGAGYNLVKGKPGKGKK